MKQYHLLYSGMALAVSLKACQTLCKQGDADATLLYLYLAAHEGMLDISQAAHDLHKTAEEVDTAIRNLAAAGAVDPSDIEPVSAEKPPEQTVPATPTVAIPEAYYTPAEVAKATEGDKVFGWLVADTESYVGHPLHQHEAEKLMILYDTVRLNAEVIPILVRYIGGDNPAKDGMSFSRMLTVGRQWAERGVHTIEDAERLILAERERDSLFHQILYAAGVRGRSPSPTERRYANAWADAGYTPELVERAYDITVTKTGGINWKYTSAILSRWFAKGIRSPEDVERVEGNAKRGYYHKNPAQPALSAAEEEEAMYARLRENYLRELAEEEEQ